MIKKLYNLYRNRNTNEMKFIIEFNKTYLMNDKKKQYEKRHMLLSSFAHQFGFDLFNMNLKWMNDDEFMKLWEGSPDKKQRKDRKYVAWSLAKSVKHLIGDSVECGVLYGATSYLICEAFKDSQSYKHHIFDSFEGLSEPEEFDKPKEQRTFEWKKHDLSVGEDVVRKNLSAYNFVNYYKGWIPTRFNEVKDLKFKFVHVDVDLYQPTKDSLDFFYDRLVPGGVLLCDDYGFESCEGAYRSFNELAERNKLSGIIHLPTGQGFLIKK